MTAQQSAPTADLQSGNQVRVPLNFWLEQKKVFTNFALLFGIIFKLNYGKGSVYLPTRHCSFTLAFVEKVSAPTP